MTLKENITAMTAVANLADVDFSAARLRFSNILYNNRVELLQISDTLRQPRPNAKAKLATFCEDYIKLFMQSFRTADKLLDRVIKEHGIPESEFENDDLKKVGIEYFPQPPLGIELWNATTPVDPPRTSFVIRSASPVLNGVEWYYKPWTFPSTFYYNTVSVGQHDPVGHAYGDLFIYDPDQVLSDEIGLWNPATKYWGPYGNVHEYIGTGEGCTEGSYAGFLRMINDLCGNVTTHDSGPDPFKYFATFDGDSTALAGKLMTRLCRKYVNPTIWKPSFKDRLDECALKVQDVNGKWYYAGIDTTTTPKRVSVYPTENTNSLFGYEIGTITGISAAPLILEGETDTDTDDSSPSCGCSWKEIGFVNNGFNITWKGPNYDYIGGDANWAPGAIQRIIIHKSNANQMLFNFNNLLKGNFGSHATVLGLDELIHKFPRQDTDAIKADAFATWFKKEASEFDDPGYTAAQLTTARSLEQAASLYAVKYALLRIMGGHARRLRSSTR